MTPTALTPTVLDGIGNTPLISADEARRLGDQPGWFCPSQFDSEDNVEENRRWLGPRWWLTQIRRGEAWDEHVE